MTANQHHLTFKEQMLVYDRVKEVCHKSDRETAIYDDDWSDGRIARELGFTTAQIARIRREAVGKLDNTPSLHTKSASGRVGAMEADLVRTKARLEQVTALADALVMWASSRKMAPFRRPGSPSLTVLADLIQRPLQKP